MGRGEEGLISGYVPLTSPLIPAWSSHGPSLLQAAKRQRLTQAAALEDERTERVRCALEGQVDGDGDGDVRASWCPEDERPEQGMIIPFIRQVWPFTCESCPSVDDGRMLMMDIENGSGQYCARADRNVRGHKTYPDPPSPLPSPSQSAGDSDRRGPCSDAGAVGQQHRSTSGQAGRGLSQVPLRPGGGGGQQGWMCVSREASKHTSIQSSHLLVPHPPFASRLSGIW